LYFVQNGERKTRKWDPARGWYKEKKGGVVSASVKAGLAQRKSNTQRNGRKWKRMKKEKANESREKAKLNKNKIH
jgi:hypothetical protein